MSKSDTHSKEELLKLLNEANERIAKLEKELTVTSVTQSQAIDDKETLLRLFFDNARDAIHIFKVDENGTPSNFIEVNAEACRRLGYTKEEMLQMSIRDIDTPAITKLIPSIVEELFKNKHLIHPCEHFRKDGTIVPSELNSHLIELDGEHIGMAVVRDTTERLKWENKLKEAKEAAEAANQAKSEFLANMSHEIRTPMNAILGFTEILKGKIKDPQLQKYLEPIYSSGKTLLNLINDILDLSKVEAGKLELQYSPVSLSQLMNDILILFKQKIKEKGLDFKIIIDDDMPVSLILDPIRTRQILINLISNSIKFTDKGSILLSAILVDNNASDKCSSVDIEIKVKDTGIGISKDQCLKIFDPFEQAKGQKLEQYGGTGLGLAITKRLIEMMNGTLTVESEVGTGSTFCIHLPSVEITSDAVNQIELQNDKALPDVQFEKVSVLIVDDIDYNREIIRTFLNEYGFDLFEAIDGNDALEKVYAHRPDIILLDMKMPGMNGYEVSKILKDDPSVSDIPVIAITASALKRDEKIIEDICNGYLRKPINKTSLVSELMKFLPHTVKHDKSPAELKVPNKQIPDYAALIQNLPEYLRKELQTAIKTQNTSCLLSMLDEVDIYAPELKTMIKAEIQNNDFSALSRLFK